MHPAYSIIFFTVSSGAGFGVLAALGLAAFLGLTPQGGLYWAGFVIGFGLSMAGLVSSTFHLGHPERAWRALSQWRSSWLSREGVLAIVALALAGAFALSLLMGGQGRLLGLLTAAFSLITVYSTSMIYAQLKTVQRWCQPLTPVVFLCFSLAGGALIYAFLAQVFAGGAGVLPTVAALLVFLAWGAKLGWWRRGDTAPVLSTPESATGLGAMGKVRMLEAPHTGGNYLLKEMGYKIGRKHQARLRQIALMLGGIVPVFATLFASWGLWPGLFLLMAVLAFLGGLLAERWLFFAEAEHSVMTYYTRT
ncbi:dimethyl sulfoxide reductase anchor subunit family protein [Rhodophyticola porphyridii]|uniref:Dibenzothiophene desulfurase n=1 Tax=Rhodophyticola porphyridii TaxID=1852017 RepID=A0A3L9XYW9_9RHOB|nr:DmsC/YnfH family molybdoenzyme membrane anchor subunit [Rhodophyticola porphyridii]RMA41831.1 dibenzothiophene desulfurase [Rhodophyticola porphyridii]